ncbi:MAG TPA: retropepsin-like aspartic protease [Mycobacteriales bacterium]
MVDIPIDIEPDPDDPGQALPYVDVEIGGETLHALLDTGAARTTVAPPEFATIEIRPGEGTGVFGIRGDRRVWRTSIRFGNRVVDPIEIDAHPAGEGRDLIGQDLLSHFRCEYRLADRRLHLDGPLPPDTVPIFIGAGHHVYLDVAWQVAEVTASAVFDTGASVTVVDTAFVDTHPTLFAKAGSSSGVDSSGTVVETPMMTMNGPQILGRQFAPSVVAIADLTAANRTIQRKMDLILGWPILHQANWVIDHPNRLAGLTP